MNLTEREMSQETNASAFFDLSNLFRNEIEEEREEQLHFTWQNTDEFFTSPRLEWLKNPR
jgi:hypothetical protein